MKIKDYKDFWSGIMFMVIGIVSLWLAQSYNMGTAARMGPGYFPAVLGGIMAFIGLIVFLTAVSFKPDAKGAPTSKGITMPLVVLVAMLFISVVAGWLGASPNASLAIGVILGCGLSLFLGLKSMGLILLAIAVFGLLLKGLGVVLSTFVLIAVAALASPEVRRNETIISAVLLAAFTVLVFIYGIKLQLPIWPDLPELQRQFMPAEKK
jgi:Tripartite tricarboxylate transporter TctB family